MLGILFILCPATPLLAFIAGWWLRGNRYFFAKWWILATYYGLIFLSILVAAATFLLEDYPVNAALAAVVGFLMFVAFVAAMSGPMLALLLVVSEHPSRYPHGHCQSCGYNLTGNLSGICPECGTPT